MAERPSVVHVVESDSDELAEVPPRPRRKGIYILPNLFTLGALFGGFYAVVMAMNGRFEQSAYGVFAAMVLDSLDGRVARMTKTQSVFGEHMDSLSDMVSFGAAPALIAYEWSLRGLGKPGWIAAFVYCSCAALRLARFNTNIGVVDKRYFQGMPSPSGAAVMVGFVWALTDLGIVPDESYWLAGVAWVVAVFAGVTMVLNVPFWSFKEVNWKKRVPLWVILACVIGLSVVASQPSLVLFALFFAYSVSGYVMWGMGHRLRPVLPED
jgi:CDP-diacylglycerol---serine O-phosphatidyltransferase